MTLTLLVVSVISRNTFNSCQFHVKARLERRNSTQLDVELSCVAIDTLTDATQLSPTIGNATDPVEQRTANQREAGHGR